MNKANQNYQTIDEYIELFSPETKEILNKIRQTIKEVAPTATETIKYQIPTFQLNGNLVHFAAFNEHIGFYPTPSGISEFKDDLSPYKTAKGSVQFPLDKEIPYALIKKIVLFRVGQNLNKK